MQHKIAQWQEQKCLCSCFCRCSSGKKVARSKIQKCLSLFVVGRFPFRRPLNVKERENVGPMLISLFDSAVGLSLSLSPSLLFFLSFLLSFSFFFLFLPSTCKMTLTHFWRQNAKCQKFRKPLLSVHFFSPTTNLPLSEKKELKRGVISPWRSGNGKRSHGTLSRAIEVKRTRHSDV